MSTLGIGIIGCGGITLQNHLPGLALCPDVRVAALCDSDAATLERARTGVFSHFEVQKGLPARRLIDHFQPREESWQASAELREMIRWRRVNLLADAPGPVTFDVIVCRGILPQTAPQMRPAVILNLAQSLAPGGVLILGRGEGEGEADVAPALKTMSGMTAVFARNPAFRAAA